ncbi:conserved hypothetical protein [Sphingomonas sp. EC-HK361]|uniref:hypothetical protein n=1 Tax=Sphingomonas sp. EC-HK361 TaxID=2038397 RepID=UPI001253A26F|nr:hypothetical protein [Sphingomonas sp. EC-HK361]VVS99201.1 conserved hypothetical protein [Sphingomonas sp. EC-HK361]
MSTETDITIERARATMQRVAEDYRGGGAPLPPLRRSQRGATLAKRLALIGGANAVLLIAAVIVGMVLPIGIFGALLVLLLMAAITLAIAFAPAARAPDPQVLRTSDLKALPTKTERWLSAQRPALPAPARTLVDQIGVRLDALTPQLATLDDGTEDALEIRRLVGEQLPDFIRDYGKVPASLRTTERNGRTPDAELVSGLKVIEQEIADMTARLAQGDLDSLSTRGRYLEMKYKGDEGA